MAVSVGVNVTLTFVLPAALGVRPGLVKVKLPDTLALLFALVAAPPLKLELLKDCPNVMAVADGAVNVGVALFTVTLTVVVVVT